MNNISLAYCNNKLQESSWIDDPFDLKTDAKRNFTMNNQIILDNFVQSLVAQYAKYDGDEYYLSLSQLSDSDQNELIRLYLETTDRDTSECIYGNDFSINNSYTCALLSMLQNDCIETREEFARVTRQNILTYYNDYLEEILTTGCYEFQSHVMSDLGFYQHIDRDNGDHLWRKYS